VEEKIKLKSVVRGGVNVGSEMITEIIPVFQAEKPFFLEGRT
jgi:hypothetical protein